MKDSAPQVKGTLEFIRLARKDPGSPEQSHKATVAQTQSIAAVWWPAYSRLSVEDSRRIMAAKTQTELRRAVRGKAPIKPLACIVLW